MLRQLLSRERVLVRELLWIAVTGEEEEVTLTHRAVAGEEHHHYILPAHPLAQLGQLLADLPGAGVPVGQQIRLDSLEQLALLRRGERFGDVLGVPGGATELAQAVAVLVDADGKDV